MWLRLTVSAVGSWVIRRGGGPETLVNLADAGWGLTPSYKIMDVSVSWWPVEICQSLVVRKASAWISEEGGRGGNMFTERAESP